MNLIIILTIIKNKKIKIKKQRTSMKRCSTVSVTQPKGKQLSQWFRHQIVKHSISSVAHDVHRQEHY